MNLFKASRQWMTRPDDEKFKSLADLHAAVAGYRAQAAEATRPYRSLRVIEHNGEPALVGPQGTPAQFTHWSFGQLSARVGAPAGYLRTLPAPLAAQNLNHGLTTLTSDDTDDDQTTAKLMFHRNGSMLVRAFTSDRYTRIWNADITSRLIRLVDMRPEWQPAPAAFDGSRGLYASDHDMFAFLVNNDRRIFEKDPNGGLSRGFFVWNSEVGSSSFGVMTFYYEYVCGNHIVWGASGVHELRIRHIGDADDRAFGSLAGELRRYADASASDDEARIESARRKLLGNDKDAVLDAVFRLRIPDLSRKLLDTAYTRAVEHADWYGDPRSVWGVVNGITEVARDVVYADERVKLDRAAGKVLQVAF